MNDKTNGRVTAYAQWIIKNKFLVLIGSVLLVGALGSGGRNLAFSSDYREFFGPDNPQVQAFEELQNVYTKNDNVMIVLAPRDGNVFTTDALTAVQTAVDGGWQIPFSIRVDGITNFQHTEAEGDDLLVQDLVRYPDELDQAGLDRARDIATNEPLLVNRLVSPSGHVTGINVTLQMPGEALDEVRQVTAAARQLAADIEAAHPEIDTYLTGMIMLNAAFEENSIKDMTTLIPLMFLGIMIVMFLSLRSVTATIGTMFVIAFSVMGAMGLAGWFGITLTAPSSTAPTMIMTLAVADSIHVLVTMLTRMRGGESKYDALVESLRVNMQPVFLTSLTTAIGFLSMNFSDSPPFHDLGNITAMGVTAAFFFSVVTLPAIVAIFPVRVRVEERGEATLMSKLADFVIHKRKPLLWGSSAVIVLLAAMVPRNDLNDQFIEYFSERIQFRVDADFSSNNLTGIYQFEYSLESGESGGISDPAYLAKVEEFADWFREQEGVRHVNVLTETLQRLNRNMHGDDPAYHRLPEERDLAAQYLLLYEMSLPYGLDLNNQINVDKSATKITVTSEDITSNDLRALAEGGTQWLQDNAPASMVAEGAGPPVMFANISARNIRGMLRGTAFAFLFVSVVLIIAFRSPRFGLLSLIPNLVPALMGFGVWALTVGRVNIALSVVAAMTFGIVVDDTVHFLSKYLRAREENNYPPGDAVRYAFSHVGRAITVTTLILSAGFGVLAFSAFDMNAGMGKLTAVTIVLALIVDFFFLPPLLMKLEGGPGQQAASRPSLRSVAQDEPAMA